MLSCQEHYSGGEPVLRHATLLNRLTSALRWVVEHCKS